MKYPNEQTEMPMKTHHIAIIAVTNVTSMKQSATEETGFNAVEAAYTWLALRRLQAEYPELRFHWVSPKGGEARMSPRSLEEAEKCEELAEFFKCEDVKRELRETRRPDEIDMEKVCMVIYIGGHGSLVDFPECQALSKISYQVWYKSRGILATISQGVAALMNLKDENRKPFVQNKEITGSTTEEEKELNEKLPYYVEDKLEALGAKFKALEPFKSNVLVTEDRLITAQNPQSSKVFANTIVEVVKRMANKF